MAIKDQAICGLTCVVCLGVAIWYTIALAFPSVMFGWISPRDIQMWSIGVPAFIGVSAVAGWIGWTMTTTPPPKPIEEIEQKEE